MRKTILILFFLLIPLTLGAIVPFLSVDVGGGLGIDYDGSRSTFGNRSAALEKLIGEPIKSRVKLKFVVTKRPLPGILKPSKSGVKPIDYMYPIDHLKDKNEIDLDWYKKMIENFIYGAFGISEKSYTEQTGLDSWM